MERIGISDVQDFGDVLEPDRRARSAANDWMTKHDG